ncbi:MAG TPA: magnesium/cobalt transporter CorA [bacterium]|nr:magnesium/cobalt transporter CorA [bacterium]
MISSFLYQKDKPLETNISRAQMFTALHHPKDNFLWVDLENPDEFESDTLVEIFNFHPLAVEDCLLDVTSPKVDDYEEYLFLVANAVDSSASDQFQTVDLNIFLGKNYVVTFHKTRIKSVELIRDGLQKKSDILIGHEPDLLVYALLDHLVDNYLPILDHYDRKIDALEEEIFNNSAKDHLSEAMQIKRDIYNLRRAVSPQRDLLYSLSRTPNALIKPTHMVYFRDVYDHLFRIYGMTEGYHETLSGLLQVYFSYQSNRLNEKINRMTVLATLTMPAVIVASIYGMNFKHMPELDWAYGYHFSLGLIIFISLSMLILMKFKKWI